MMAVFSVMGASPAVHPWGIGISFTGASYVGGTEPVPSTDISLSAYAAPWDLKILNPSLRGSVDFRFSKDVSGFSGFRISLGLDVVRTANHPFGWLVTNKALWVPMIEVGGSYAAWKTGRSPLTFHLAAIPFRLAHRDFIYEWFGVYADMAGDAWKVDEWGIILYRGTMLL